MKELLKSRIKKKEKNEFYKLFNYILYQNNNRNKNRNAFNNNIILKEILNKEKPIVIEHFIKEENYNDNDFINFNNNNNGIINNYKNFNNSKKNYNLDLKIKNKTHQKRYSFSSKNSRINLSSIINEIHQTKNFNKKIDSACQIENKFNFIVGNDDDNNNFLFFNKKIQENIKSIKKEKLNLVLFPIKKLYKIENENIKRRNILFKNNSNNNNDNAKYKSKKFQFIKKRSKSSFFRETNDMNQRIRFVKLKKDLSEEANKINNMFSEFFKSPLYNKFNKIDKIEDLKLKNSLKRPRSVLSS